MIGDSAVHISEMFGPTLQGEGPSAGVLATFLRLTGCNLSCAWCDTPYTWDWDRFDRKTESRRVAVTEVAAWLAANPTPLLVITGGEPLLQQRAVATIAAHAGRRVEVETNGTRIPTAQVVAAVTQFNVSPKLGNAAIPLYKRIDAAALSALAATGKAVFKFVAANPGDLDEIDVLTPYLGDSPVWVMPEGTEPEKVLTRLRTLADPVIARGWNLSSRMHVLIWGDERGR
jgi:7-carboxy-7-deazaguanine synthase